MHEKIIVNQHIIEVYQYQKMNIKQDNSTLFRSDYGTSLDYENNYERTIRSRRTLVYQLAIANFSENSKFYTLTFKDNETDVIQCNKKFKAFIRSIKKYHKKECKYLAVIEFQKRGAIHYHMIIQIDYIPHSWLLKNWKHGSINAKRINHVDNIGAYVTAYMIKSHDERLKKLKGYNCSQKLDRPNIYTTWRTHEERNIINGIKEVYKLDKRKATRTSEYQTPIGSTIKYYQYNLKRNERKSQQNETEISRIRT